MQSIALHSSKVFVFIILILNDDDIVVVVVDVVDVVVVVVVFVMITIIQWLCLFNYNPFYNVLDLIYVLLFYKACHKNK